MTPETAAALREPFPTHEVGKLPRITCPECRDKKCSRHERARCHECGNFITPAHIHLDYVGHAEVTDRLLKLDPEWTWEPVGLDDHGLPAFDAIGGLWIRLTVAGVTRHGYGHANGKGGDSVKEIIGDALRNGAMRFGVGLDMWRRSESGGEAEEGPAPSEIRGQIAGLSEAKGWDLSDVSEDFTRVTGADIRTASARQLTDYRETFRGYADAE